MTPPAWQDQPLFHLGSAYNVSLVSGDQVSSQQADQGNQDTDLDLLTEETFDCFIDSSFLPSPGTNKIHSSFQLLVCGQNLKVYQVSSQQADQGNQDTGQICSLRKPLTASQTVLFSLAQEQIKYIHLSSYWFVGRILRSPQRSTRRSYHLSRQIPTHKVKSVNPKGSESEIAQSCLTLCDPMHCSLPGSSIHGIFQARRLETVAISFSRGSSRLRD